MTDQTTELEPAPEQDQGQAEGSPPETETTSAGPTEAERELRRALTEKGEELASYKDALDILKQNPEWTVKDLQTYVGGGDPNASGNGFPERAEQIISQFEDEGTQNALRELTTVLREDARELARQEFAPVASRLQNTEVRTASERGALLGGMTLDEMRTADFKEFLAEYEAQKPWLATARTTHPEDVAREVAVAFKDSRQGHQRAQKRLENARDSSLSTTQSSGVATTAAANSKVKLPKGKASMRQIRKVLADGKEIDWV